MEMPVARILSNNLPIVEREGRPQEIAADREQHLAHVHSISLIFLIPLVEIFTHEKRACSSAVRAGDS